VHVRSFQEVHADLVEISDGADNMGADMALVVKGLEATIDPDIGVLFQGGVGSVGRRVAVDPLLYFDEAGTIVEFVSNVCGLGGDGADLTDEGDL
jgi:hypothetical protein